MKEMLSKILRTLLPRDMYRTLIGYYHYVLAHLGVYIHGRASRKLTVIAVTGTKGKSSTVEIIRSMLAEAGYKVAAMSTIRFCVGDECERNLYKMTMPGRFFLARFLRRALEAGCTHAVIEMTSEGAVQFRHSATELNALVFTNLAPEHLESHGGMEAYAQAKLSLARHLERSPKRPRIIVANADDEYGKRFLAANVEVRAPFSLHDAEPWSADESGARFFWRGELFTSPLPGIFNLRNTLAALTLCEALGVPQAALKRAVDKTKVISGRAERIECGQDFTVVVDYAHTPDSLRAIFEAFRTTRRNESEGRLICLIGSTGGGRDTWNRPIKGAVSEELCDLSIITDEDPYDENPEAIAREIATGFKRKTPRVVMNRRKAIREALEAAKPGDAVLITGKGTDPYIMRANGQKEPWSDRAVAEEELRDMLAQK